MPCPFQFLLPPYDGAGGLTPEQRGAVDCDQAMFQGVAGTEARALTDRLRTELFNIGVNKVVERGMMEEVLVR